MSSQTLQVRAQGEREIVMTRGFHAPRQLVYDAFRTPELLRRWFGPRGWTLPVCEMDWRVGGTFRFILEGPDGQKMGMRGTFLELDIPSRSVHLETFDDYPGESRVTTLFEEAQGGVTMTVTVEYPTTAVRDAMLTGGMAKGAGEVYDRLEDLAQLPEFRRTLTVGPSGERDVVMTRAFQAPRQLVFDAFTKPELVRRWLGVRNNWRFDVCEIDLRVGGRYRYVWKRDDKGLTLGVSGEYREINAPELVRNTEKFDEAWYEGEGLVCTEFAERQGWTTVTMTCTAVSRESRDGILRSPMARGVRESYDVLEAILADSTTAA